MFKLKAKLKGELPIVRKGLIFKDKRSSGSTIYTLESIAEISNITGEITYKASSSGLKGWSPNWTSDFLERELKQNGCLTFMGYKDL